MKFADKEEKLREEQSSMIGKPPVDLNQLAKTTKKYKSGKIPPVDWLDRLTFAEVEKMSQRQKQNSNLLFLMLEFPQIHADSIKHSVVYFEKNGDVPNVNKSKSDILKYNDPEIEEKNLVDMKHNKLFRARRVGQSESDKKPNATQRDRLHEIVAYPTTQILTSEEKDLVWKYQVYLSANKKALAKFVKCVNWQTNPELPEATQALELVSAAQNQFQFEFISLPQVSKMITEFSRNYDKKGKFSSNNIHIIFEIINFRGIFANWEELP